MLKPIILEDFSWQKLDIMTFFVQMEAGNYTINTVCNGLNLSYTAGSTLVTDIHNDLLELNGCEFLTCNGKIQWAPEKYQHNQYIQYLLRQSIAYSFIVETLVHPETTFEEFCQKFYLSHSTVLRKLKPLKDYLQEFNIKLMASKMKIVGRESLLRMFYTVYLWAGNHGEDILEGPFDFSAELQLMADNGFDDAEFMHPKEIFLRLAVNRLRSDQGHYLATAPIETLSFSGLIEPIIAYSEQFLTDQLRIQNHARFLCYMLHFTPVYLNIEDFRVTALNDYFEELKAQQSPIAALVEEYEDFFFSELVDTNQIDYEESFLLHINILVTLINYVVHEGNAPMIMNIARHLPPGEEGLFDELKKKNAVFFRKVVRRKDFGWLSKYVNELLIDLTFTVLPTYKETMKKDKLNVAILTTPDYYVSQNIKEMLKQFSFVKIHYANFDSPEIDFFVTTFESLLPAGLEKPYYIVDLVQGDDYQADIFQATWAAYKEKLRLASLQSVDQQI